MTGLGLEGRTLHKHVYLQEYTNISGSKTKAKDEKSTISKAKTKKQLLGKVMKTRVIPCLEIYKTPDEIYLALQYNRYPFPQVNHSSLEFGFPEHSKD